MNRLKQFLKNFFLAPGSPYNLAVFRIVIFGYVFLKFSTEKTLWWAHLPPTLMAPPIGMRWVLSYFPPNGEWLHTACMIFLVACLSAALGLFTRITSVLSLLLATYLLSIPNSWGKVGHTHHLIWFMALLAVSSCADVLSIDAIWRKFRFPQDAREQQNASKYTLPLRFAWVLIGIIYFFPGFWKLRTQGLDWAFSDNLILMMHTNWTYLSWLPMIRLDRYPDLCKIAALFTLLFEVSFIFLVFLGRARWIGVGLGLFFHTMTLAFMQISFSSLKWSYVCFFDFSKIFHRFSSSKESGEKLQPTQMWSLIPIYGMAVVLILPNLLLGFRGTENGWPFACYPTFREKRNETGLRYSLDLFSVDGQDLSSRAHAVFSQRMNEGQLTPMLEKLAYLKGSPREQAIREIADFVKSENPGIARISNLRLYRETISKSPEEWSKNPLSRAMIFEAKFH